MKTLNMKKMKTENGKYKYKLKISTRSARNTRFTNII